MSQLKYCQGPKCHMYDTKDRKRGPKDNKRNETRRRSSFYYLNNNACSMQCQADWFDVYGSRALDHFGRTTQPKVLTLIMPGARVMIGIEMGAIDIMSITI